jgi:DnaK suppressor protein
MVNRTKITIAQIQDLKLILEQRHKLLEAQETLDFSKLVKVSEDGLDAKHEEFSESNSTLAAEQELTQRHSNEMRQIEQAFARMRLGTFGICIDCESAIDFPRLLAYPTALRCMTCQEAFELLEKRGL